MGNKICPSNFIPNFWEGGRRYEIEIEDEDCPFLTERNGKPHCAYNDSYDPYLRGDCPNCPAGGREYAR